MLKPFEYEPFANNEFIQIKLNNGMCSVLSQCFIEFGDSDIIKQIGECLGEYKNRVRGLIERREENYSILIDHDDVRILKVSIETLKPISTACLNSTTMNTAVKAFGLQALNVYNSHFGINEKKKPKVINDFNEYVVCGINKKMQTATIMFSRKALNTIANIIGDKHEVSETFEELLKEMD